MTVASPPPPARTFASRVTVAVAIVALAWIAFQLLEVLMVVFGAVLLATALHTLATPLARRTGWPRQLALGVVVVGIVLVLALGGWLVGDRMLEQLAALREVLPRARDDAMRWLQGHPLGTTVLELWNDARNDGEVWSRLTHYATLSFSALGGALLILVAGIYLAADPGLYRRGLLRLLPARLRGRVDGALLDAGHGLARWLLGQAVSMLVIGTLTALGLWALGMPLAFTLGLITGVLAFVPFFGAVTAGVLVTLLAFTQGPLQALHAGLLYLAIQQVEGHAVLPLVHRWSVRLPPALGLVAVLIFSVLFGPLGALFATPLMVVVMILVERLYVEQVTEPVR